MDDNFWKMVWFSVSCPLATLPELSVLMSRFTLRVPKVNATHYN